MKIKMRTPLGRGVLTMCCPLCSYVASHHAEDETLRRHSGVTSCTPDNTQARRVRPPAPAFLKQHTHRGYNPTNIAERCQFGQGPIILGAASRSTDRGPAP